MSKTVIETTSLTKAYGTQISVDHINLHVRRGTIYGLLGRNGAGKTATMKMLLGLINPTDGKAFVLGKDIQKEKKKILSHIGASIETPGFYANLTGRENLQIFSEYSGRKDNAEIKSVLEQVGLPYRDKKIFSQYSLGMKQRLAIACAIMHNPDILVLDEPTNGLDPIGILEMRAFIKNLCDEQGKTILISSHILQEIEMLADDIGIIDKGKLIEESSKEELSIKREKYIKLQVSDTDGVVKILRDQYQSPRYKLSAKGELLIYDSKINIEEFVRDLIMAGIGVREVGVIEENLESYFIRVTGGWTLVKLLQNELKKFKNQRMTRVLVLLAASVPIADVFLCLKLHLGYKNLNGLNILFGNFLVMPCLFLMSLVALLQTEEQNDALKNILLSGVSKWKILFVKISAVFMIAFVFVILVWGIGLVGGLITGGTLYPIKGLIPMVITGIAVLFASSPILIAVVIFRKNFLLSLIISNCLLIVNFLFTWQLTMLNGLNIYMPICIAMRITYPHQIVEYAQNLQYGLDALYFPELTGWAILIFIVVLSVATSLFIYENQEV